jgi:hypothetical protein
MPQIPWVRGLIYSSSSYFELMCMSAEIKREEIYRWIKPETLDDGGEKFNESYIQGSCDWITFEDKFKVWRGEGNNTAQRLLWVHGDMGYGKTFLSQASPLSSKCVSSH